MLPTIIMTGVSDDREHEVQIVDSSRFDASGFMPVSEIKVLWAGEVGVFENLRLYLDPNWRWRRAMREARVAERNRPGPYRPRITRRAFRR